MTTANQKATWTYQILNGPSRDELAFAMSLIGRVPDDAVKPISFDVNNNAYGFIGDRKVVYPGHVMVLVRGLKALDMSGRYWEITGIIFSDSAHRQAAGTFRAYYDTQYRGRRDKRVDWTMLQHRLHVPINTIELYVK